MSRFTSDKLQTIELSEWEWVKIPVSLSYEQVMKFTKENEFETSKSMLSECIKEWNIKDDEWNIPELNSENILKLDIQTITIISTEITKLLTNDQDKKK